MASLKRWQVQQRQGQPLAIKVELSLSRIRQWYDYWDGRVYVSFSGGMDSTVLLHLARSIYPNIPAVFVRALPYPEIMEHIRATNNVSIFKPEKSFAQVIQEYGWPVVSKRMAQYIGEVQRAKGDTPTKRLRLTGYKSNGEYTHLGRISKKWLYLCEAPFSISDRCCHWLKKKPFLAAEKRYGKPLIGIRVAESAQRKEVYLKHGCNAINIKRPRSWPIAFWTTKDIWLYIDRFQVPYSRLYNMGYHRSGCFPCPFGAHMEQEPNRFQKMQALQPRLWEWCTRIGLPEILDYLHIPYSWSRQIPLLLKFKDT